MQDILESMISNIRLIDILALIFAFVGAFITLKDYKARREIAEIRYGIINDFEKDQPIAILPFFEAVKDISQKDFKNERLKHLYTCNEVLKVFDVINNEFNFIFSLPYRNAEMIKTMPCHLRIQGHLLQMIAILGLSDKANKDEFDYLYNAFIGNAKESYVLYKEMIGNL